MAGDEGRVHREREREEGGGVAGDEGRVNGLKNGY